MSVFHHPEPASLTLPEVLHALGDATRLAIVRKLAENGALSCGEVCTRTPRSTLTHHLKILRDAGLIHTEKTGQTHRNTLRSAELEQRFPGLLTGILRQNS